MFVLIAGGGRTGARLANLLINQNYKVRLVENRRLNPGLAAILRPVHASLGRPGSQPAEFYASWNLKEGPQDEGPAPPPDLVVG